MGCSFSNGKGLRHFLHGHPDGVVVLHNFVRASSVFITVAISIPLTTAAAKLDLAQNFRESA